MSILFSVVVSLFLVTFVAFQIGAYYKGATRGFARIKAGERTIRRFALVMMDGGLFGVCVAVLAFSAACAAATMTSGWGLVMGIVALGFGGLGLWAGGSKEKGR